MEQKSPESSNSEVVLLLQRFIDSFKKAIKVEMETMQKRLGPFEVQLTDSQVLESDEKDKTKYYIFSVLKPNEKLVLHTECTLRSTTEENLVTITKIDKNKITLGCNKNIDLTPSDHILVIYPWFLYERLILVLDSLAHQPHHFISNALMLFGKVPPQSNPKKFKTEHLELNKSQKKAVQLCSDSNLAFVWGPPGTGKTTTLGHIVTELLAQKKRILITSTTNAAVDQALEKLSNLAIAQNYFKQGQIIRIGQTSEETFEASLPEVVGQLNLDNQKKLEYFRNRHLLIKNMVKDCDVLIKRLKTSTEPQQLNIFGEVNSTTIDRNELNLLFKQKRRNTILTLPPELQLSTITNREKRLNNLSDLYWKKIVEINESMRQQESSAIQNANVILSTMANVYISPLLVRELFDVVIVEEAGMAILPSLFYCATLSKEKIVIVGDPKQLPPIVQSKEKYVQKVMARNIFDITATGPDNDEFVVMLDTQYRMHPIIGNLVSHLFYNGKLKNNSNTNERELISKMDPYPGYPLVVVDTESLTKCQIREGSFSRFNEKTAEFCISLAIDAVQSGIESVAIITPYVAQSVLFKQLLTSHSREAQYIDCRTVHRFQGGERDLVILDTVDTSPFPPGILLSGRQSNSSAKNLINVAISRARGKLIIVSDVAYFKTNSPKSAIHTVLKHAIKQGNLVSLE
jgi:superfamily I DNA and/or RNA helicase